MSLLLDLGAKQTAQAIAKGEVSAVEAVEARIVRIEAVNGELNAVIWKRFGDARAEARAVDQKRKAGEALGPFAGVPITIKDSIDLKGAPSTFGLPSRKDILAERDETHARRLRDAGAVVLGKTNVAQMLLSFESSNPLFGRVNNPWDLRRSSGGSSGGEGVIIAARGSTLGIGTDLGGSVRIPASFNGIASIKPTAGRCPDVGRFSYPLGQTVVESQVGVLARLVEDVALGLEVINGGANPSLEPPRPLADHRAVDVAKLSVGVCDSDGILTPCPAAKRAVREAAAALKAAGANVFAWQMPRVEEGVALYYGAMTAGGRLYKRILGGNKADPTIKQLLQFASMSHGGAKRLAGLLRLIGQKSLADGVANFGYRSTEEYWDIVERAQAYRAAFATAMDQANRMDLVLLPGTALPAVTHGATADLGTIGAYTILFNILGLPAGTVPVTRVQDGEESERAKSGDRMEATARKVELGSAGMPISVQVVGRAWREHTVLAAMQVIEANARTSPTFPERPPL